mgnify:FL=1
MDNTSNPWHLDKKVGIGQIISIVSMCIIVTAGWMSFDKRITVVETNQANINSRIITLFENQTKTDQAQNEQIERSRAETQRSLRDIDAKLDRLIERL